MAFLFLAGFSLPATAQEPKATAPESAAPETPAKPVPQKPQAEKPPAKPSEKPAAVTSKTFGGWALRCRQGSEGAEKACEISQTIESRDQSGPIAKISVGRPKPGDSLHVVIILPNNVSFPSTVHLRSEEGDKWGFELDWQRCIPGGCFAEAELNDATTAHWRGLKGMGSIVFRDSAGDEISLPMSFEGFGEALDALNK